MAAIGVEATYEAIRRDFIVTTVFCMSNLFFRLHKERRMTEFWTISYPLPGTPEKSSQLAEKQGWDGILYTDSQNHNGDCYAALAIAAKATKRIGLGTGVTNPYTRHAAVTASAISTIQVESNGRAVLGVGRGDSAMARRGLRPSPL